MRLIDAEPMPTGPMWTTLTDKEKAHLLGYLISAPTVRPLDAMRQVIEEHKTLPKSIRDEYLDYLDDMETVLLAWSE